MSEIRSYISSTFAILPGGWRVSEKSAPTSFILTEPPAAHRLPIGTRAAYQVAARENPTRPTRPIGHLRQFIKFPWSLILVFMLLALGVVIGLSRPCDIEKVSQVDLLKSG